MRLADRAYDIVHAVAGYWDGPRSGVADFRGRPHVFESRFDEADVGGHGTFWLAAVDPATARLAADVPPADGTGGPPDRRELGTRLSAVASRRFVARGKFRRRDDPMPAAVDAAPLLEVHWTPVIDPTAEPPPWFDADDEYRHAE